MGQVGFKPKSEAERTLSRQEMGSCSKNSRQHSLEVRSGWGLGENESIGKIKFM